tara:strand:- start:160 stop:300 length:141 start_codon:yes stop_codon:yes gene_type:complete
MLKILTNKMKGGEKIRWRNGRCYNGRGQRIYNPAGYRYVVRKNRGW